MKTKIAVIAVSLVYGVVFWLIAFLSPKEEAIIFDKPILTPHVPIQKEVKSDSFVPSIPSLSLRESQGDFSGQKVCNAYKINKVSLTSQSRLDDTLSGVLSNKGAVFIRVGKANKIDFLFLASVAIHESGNGTSHLARNRNNVCGIYNSKAKDYQTFKSVDDCITYTGALLAGYVARQLDTIERVQRVYCPIGASNDPKHLNGLWLSGVQKWMEKIAGENILYSNEHFNLTNPFLVVN